MPRIEKRLYPNTVSGKKQTPFLLLPNGKGKNPVALFHAVRSKSGVGVEQHFGVGMAGKTVPQFQQVMAQFLGIIKFPVINQGISLSCPV